MKTLMTNKVVCFVVGKFKILENKLNTTQVSENKQRLMGNLKSAFLFSWLDSPSGSRPPHW